MKAEGRPRGGGSPASWARFTVQVTILIAIAMAGGAAGYALRGRQMAEAEQNYEIRQGRRDFINPLLECEVAGYRRGRELRPFGQRINALVDDLMRRGMADRVSVYFRDLDNGPWFGIREEETYTPASLLKVPTIMAALSQAERDPSLLARQVRFYGIPGGMPRGGYLPEDQLVVGRSYTVADLVRRTAAYSDNAAVALLGQQLEPAVQERLLGDLGLLTKSSPRQGIAALSARTYGQLFRVLYNASYLTREMSDLALASFAQSTFVGGLVAGLPDGTVVAHKFGIYDLPWKKGEGQLHDCGIVYYEKRPYFLCVMTQGNDVDLLAQVIQDVSRAVYAEVSTQDVQEPLGEEIFRLFSR